MLQVVSALEITAISRLSLTWKHIGAKYAEKYEKLQALANPEMNYRNYRAELLERCSGGRIPFIPFVGCWMKDLTFIEEVPTFTEKGLLNWSKMENVHAIVDTLERAKSRRYDIEPDEALQEFLLSRPSMEEREQYRVSKLLETGGQAPKEVKIKGTYKTREKEREKRALRLRKSLQHTLAAAAASSSSGSLTEGPRSNQQQQSPIDALASRLPEHGRSNLKAVSAALMQSRIHSLGRDLASCDRIRKQLLQPHLPLLYACPRADETVSRLTLAQIVEASVKLFRLESQLANKEAFIERHRSAEAQLVALQTARNRLISNVLQSIANLLRLLQSLSLSPLHPTQELVLQFARDQVAVFLPVLRERASTPLKIPAIAPLPSSAIHASRGSPISAVGSPISTSSFKAKPRDRRGTTAKNS